MKYRKVTIDLGQNIKAHIVQQRHFLFGWKNACSKEAMDWLTDKVCTNALTR